MPEEISTTRLTSNPLVIPSDNLVTSILKRTDEDTEKGRKFVLSRWENIQLEQPAIARLINVNSYRLAPNDADTRQIIASSMVLLYIALSEAEMQKDLTAVLEYSLSQYFPVKS